jgi:hypothetical protein
MRLILFGVTAVALVAAAPALAQRDPASLRSREAIEQDARNALVDAANRANSIDPTDPIKRANRQGALLRGDGKNFLTLAVARHLMDAAEHMEAGRPSQALDAVRDARTKATRLYDRIKAYQFLTLIHLHLKDEEAAAAAAEAVADIAALPEAEKKSIYTNAALLALNVRHYDKALRYARAMQALGMDDAASRVIIGRALYFGGDKYGAIDILRRQIDAELASGGKPDLAMLQIVLSAHAQTQSPQEAGEALELLKRYYDDPRNWQSIIEMMRQIDIWAVQSREADLKARGLLPGGT